MHIEKLRIRNYRNFGEPPFEIMLKPFTLILGENNVGKTNLINAIGLILSQELGITRRRVLEIDDINFDSVQKFRIQVADPEVPPAKIQFPVVRIDIVLTDMNVDQQAVVGQWAIDQAISKAQITYTFEPKLSFKKTEWILGTRKILAQLNVTIDDMFKFVDFPIEEYRYSLFGGGDPTRQCDGYYLNMLKLEHLDALRDAQRELIASGDYRLLYRVLSKRDPDQYIDLKNKLAELDKVISDNPNLSTLKSDVRLLLNRVSLTTPGTENSIDLRFSAPEISEILKKLSMIYGADPIDVSRNGLGRNNLLYISLILSHLANGGRQEIYFRSVAIEEPEAHLHPHLQDHLAKNIEDIQLESNGAMQLIITSHSTHIAAKLSLDNTVVVYKDGQSNCLKSHYVTANMDPIKDRNTIRYLSVTFVQSEAGSVKSGQK